MKLAINKMELKIGNSCVLNVKFKENLFIKNSGWKNYNIMI